MRMIAGTIFQPKPIILIFWNKFVLKKYFRVKREKGNITIKFSTFDLAYVPNSNLNFQF